MQPRGPIVTILGHVDHGKTSLLDYIRKSRITQKEHGGITQRIGAYEVDTGLKGYPSSKITFIDTPGHEAFSKLRSRGAKAADVAILVVDAKDSLMPQTIESIAHIQSAKIPLIVALNKCDLAEAQPEKVERDLLKYNVQTEHQGGTIPAVKISAKTGKGIPDLLETILLLTSDAKLSYEDKNPAKALIVETNKDKRGVVISIIVIDGVIKPGDTLYAQDGKKAKIRALISDTGVNLKEVTPSTPCQILGFSELPDVGTILTSSITETKDPNAKPDAKKAFSIDDIIGETEGEKKLKVIIRTDSQGSLEALKDSLDKRIEVVSTGIGAIHRSDVFLAKTTGAIVIGFSVDADHETQELARQEKVVIKTYSVIYEILEELEEVSDLMAEKEAATKNLKAEAKVLAIFEIEGEKIIGASITKGKFNLGDEIEAFREGNSFNKAKIISLKNRAKNIAEAKRGEECGILLSPQLDIRVNDVIKCIL